MAEVVAVVAALSSFAQLADYVCRASKSVPFAIQRNYTPRYYYIIAHGLIDCDTVERALYVQVSLVSWS